jgi:hypothetical protein
MDDLYTNSEEFLGLVAQLRRLSPQMRSLAHYAADWWTDVEFMERLMRADVPAEPPLPPKPTLRVIQ